MVRLLALLVRMPVLWYSTNSIMGGGSRFSSEGDDKKGKENHPPEKKPEPVAGKREREMQSLSELIADLDKEIAELTDSRDVAKKLLDRLKKGGA